MKEIEKLKKEKSAKEITIGVIFCIIIFTLLIIFQTSGLDKVGDRLTGFLYIGISLGLILIWFKTKVSTIIPVFVSNIVCAFMFFVPNPGKIFFIFLMVIMLGISGYVGFGFIRSQRNNRRILELVAKPVKDAANGFTSRPYSVGKISFSPGEMLGFTEFLKKKKVALSYKDGESIIITLPGDWYNRQFNIHGSYLDDTRVTFTKEGQVTTIITEKDYKRYKDQLTFDQLCGNLGNLFIDLFEFYKNGQTDKILELINNKGRNYEKG